MFNLRSEFQKHLASIEKQESHVKKYADLVDADQRMKFEEGLGTLTLEEMFNFDHLKTTLKESQRPINRMEMRLKKIDFLKTVYKQVTLIYQALKAEDDALVETALETWPRDSRFNKYLDMALMKAVCYRNEACVKALLAKGADANFKFEGESVIDAVRKYERYGEQVSGSMLHLLLDHGAVLEGKVMALPHTRNSGTRGQRVSWTSSSCR